MSLKAYNRVVRKIADQNSMQYGFTQKARIVRAKWIVQLRQDFPYSKVRVSHGLR